MAYQYIVGVGGILIAALFLGFVFLYYNSLRGLKKTTRDSMEEFPLENQVTKTGFGEVIAGTTDIIIVGFGVAGAALSFALGKVCIFLYFHEI